jgi:hypothetical protein
MGVAWLLLGVLQNSGASRWFFDGEFVVSLWFFVVIEMVVLRGEDFPCFEK